jgi:hypothetical protein
MPIVQPPHERHFIRDEGSSLTVIIPSNKNYFTMFFLGIWLVGWTFGEVMVGGIVIAGILKLLSGTSEISMSGLAGIAGGGGLFMLVWLTFWTIGGAFAIYTFLWQLVGKEIVEISYEAIKIQRAVAGFGRKKEYLASYIKDLRVSPLAADSNYPFGRSRASSFYGLSGGPLAFDYGAKTFRFGSGVDEAEAKQILEKIVSRFPQFRARTS